MGTGFFPGLKIGRGVTLTLHLLLVPWSWNSRAISLLTLWTVRHVQSFRLPQCFFLCTCFSLLHLHIPNTVDTLSLASANDNCGKLVTGTILYPCVSRWIFCVINLFKKAELQCLYKGALYLTLRIFAMFVRYHVLAPAHPLRFVKRILFIISFICKLCTHEVLLPLLATLFITVSTGNESSFKQEELNFFQVTHLYRHNKNCCCSYLIMYQAYDFPQVIPSWKFNSLIKSIVAYNFNINEFPVEYNSGSYSRSYCLRLALIILDYSNILIYIQQDATLHSSFYL
jgi:hypothetical protein